MIDPITAAIAWVGAEVGGAIGASLIMNAGAIATFTAFTATIAGSAAMQRRAKTRARAAYNASLKDREMTFRSAIAPRRVVYGRDRVGGVLVYAQSTGAKKQFLHVVLALAAHECDAIEEIWFGDEKLPDPDADGWIASGPFGSVAGKRGTWYGVTSGAGTITLPRPAHRITDISQAATESVDGSAYVGVHTEGSNLISGLPAGIPVSVGYEYSDPARKVRVRKHLGGAGQVADADLVAESGGAWTSAHKGAGICYLYLRLEYDQDIFSAFDLSRVMCVVRGKRLPDPRTSTTAWTDNGALIAADWLQDQTFGMRASVDEVPASEVIAAANICDEAVVISGGGATQARYIFNGSITSDQSPRDVLEDLLACMAGECVWTQGRWLLRPGAYRTPEAGAEITVDHLAGGGVVVTPKSSRSALFNGVRATYRDPAQGWAEVQAPVVTNPAYVAQDGGVAVVRSITLPSAMDSLRAQRLAKIELERGRQAVTVQASTSLRAYNYAPTDTCLLILPRYGWGSGKVFEVVNRTWSAEGLLHYTWRETAAAVYAWNLGEATIEDPAPDTDLPSPYTRPAPLASLAVASGTAQLWRQADGTIISRARASWAPSADQFVIEGGRIEVQWMLGGTVDKWQSLPALPGAAEEAWITPVPDGQVLVVRVRQVNPLGVRSSWTYESVVVAGKTDAPGNAASFAGTVLKARVRWAWARPAELDYAYTEVRSSDNNWGSDADPPLWRGDANDWTEAVASPAVMTRYIRHFDASGNYSAAAASATAAVLSSDLVVGTADLAVDAATKVHTVTASGVAVTGEKGAPFGTFTTLASITITPPVSCEVLIAVDGSVSINTATSGTLGDYAMLSTRLVVNGTQLGPLRTYAIDLPVGFNKTVSATVARAMSFAATGGVAYTVVLEGQQYVVATTCTVDDMRMRLEEIRR